MNKTILDEEITKEEILNNIQKHLKTIYLNKEFV
jgi:hypothetical protein